MDWAGLIKTAAPLIMSGMGNMAAGKTAGRAATNAHTANNDVLSLNAQGQEENAAQNRARLEMDQKEAQRAALNDAYKNAMQSSLAMNMQDSVVGKLPKGVPSISFSGGMRPSAFGAEGKAAAAAMNSSAMRSLMNPDALTTLAPQKHFTPSPMQQAGKMENIMGIAGMVGSGIQQHKAQGQADENNSLVQRLIASLRGGDGDSSAGSNDGILTNPTA